MAGEENTVRALVASLDSCERSCMHGWDPMKLSILFALLLSAVFASAAPAETQAPDVTVKDFFTYLLAAKRDISTDPEAQERWLTKSLRQVLANASTAATKAMKARPDEKIDVPGNETFLAAWDKPTTFNLTETKSTPPSARVGLRYTWGPKTNYPGEKRNMTVLLTLEDGAWRVNDIQCHTSKFSEEGTLRKDLRELAAQK